MELLKIAIINKIIIIREILRSLAILIKVIKREIMRLIIIIIYI